MIGRRTFLAGAGATLAAAPRFARAQDEKVPRIAMVHASRPVEHLSQTGRPRWVAFHDELRRLGLREGENLTIEIWSGKGRADLDVLAREIVATNPDAILASSGPSMAPPLARQTKTIPIVCVGGMDLVRLGIAVSVARPEGNVTGFTTDGGGSIEGKRLQLLHDTIPDVPRVAFLTPRYALESANGSYARAAAPSLGVELALMILQEPIAEQTYHDAFARMSSDGVKSLLLAQSAENGTFAPLTGRLSRQSGIPAMSTYRDHSEAGGLMSFGTYYPDVYRRAAGYVARILAGEPPRELPIQDPVKFDFIINLAAARELGITFRNKILLGATEVIE